MNGSKSTKEVPKGVLNLLLYESNPWKQRKATGKKANTRDHDQHFSGVMSRGFIDEIEFALWFHFVYIIWLNNLIPKRWRFVPLQAPILHNIPAKSSQMFQWTSKHPLAQHRVCVQDCPSASERSVEWHQAWSQVQLSLIIAAQQIDYSRIKPMQPMQFE